MLLGVAMLLTPRPPVVPRLAVQTVSMLGPQPNEFSRPISVAGLGRKASRNAIEATAEECAALATRFDLEGLSTLIANVSLAVLDPRRSRVRAYGSFAATDVGKRGSETLQIDPPVKFETFYIDEDLLYIQPTSSGANDAEDESAYDEPIEDGSIDIGELVAQHLYLWLSERELAAFREAAGEFTPGTVVIDSDPDSKSE